MGRGSCSSSLSLTSSISPVLYRTHKVQVCLRGHNYKSHLWQLAISLPCQPKQWEHHEQGEHLKRDSALVLTAENRRVRGSSASSSEFIYSCQGHIYRCQLQGQIITIYMSVPLPSLLVTTLKRTTNFFTASRGTCKGVCP